MHQITAEVGTFWHDVTDPDVEDEFMAAAVKALNFPNNTGPSPLIDITRLMDNGEREVSTFDHIANPGRTCTATIFNPADEIVGTKIYLSGDVTIRKNLDASGILRDNEDTRSWTMATETFEDGARTGKVTQLDSGATIASTFDDGQLVRLVHTDDSETRNLAEMTRHFDMSGAVTADEVVSDDGRLISRSYDDMGRLTASVLERDDHASGWIRREEMVDEGQLALQEVTNTNGDIVTRHYCDTGMLETQRYRDISDQRPWTELVRNYDTAGELVRIETDGVLVMD